MRPLDVRHGVVLALAMTLLQCSGSGSGRTYGGGGGSAASLGGACQENGDCDDGLVCQTAFTAGYCTKACLADEDCGPDGACVAGGASGTRMCMNTCSDGADCREADAYTCDVAELGKPLVCVPPVQSTGSSSGGGAGNTTSSSSSTGGGATSGGVTSSSSSSSSSSGGGGGWTCTQSWYGTGDGCDCGCGIPDPDCTTGCTTPGCNVAGCEYCHVTGTDITPCSGGGTSSSSSGGGGCAPPNRVCGGACASCPSTGVEALGCSGTECVATSCGRDHYPCGTGCCPLMEESSFAPPADMGDVALAAPPGLGLVLTFTDQNRDRLRFAARSTGWTPETIYTDPDLWPDRGLAHAASGTTVLFQVDSALRVATRSGTSWNGGQIRNNTLATTLNMVRCPDGTRHGVFRNAYGATTDHGLFTLDEESGSYVARDTGVDTNSYESPPMFCDQDNWVHLAYYERSSTNQLVYRFKGPGAATYGGGAVTGAGPACAVSMHVSNDGLDVHLAYVDTSEQSLKYAHYDNGWTIQTVATELFTSSGCSLYAETALGVLPDGSVHILYKKNLGTSTAHYAYSTASGFKTMDMLFTPTGIGGVAVEDSTLYLLMKGLGGWTLYRR